MKRTKTILLSLLVSVVGYGQNKANKVFDMIVASDGSGNCISVQAAINAAPANSTRPYLIFIKNGIYDELVDIPAEKTYIHLIGQDANSTIIRHTMHCGGKDSKQFEYSVNNPQSENYKHHAVMDNWGSNFYMENITLENSWGTRQQAGPQALAIRTFADRMAFYNCRFLSFQDTWFTTTNDTDRHYIKKCHLEGAVDYIYGSGDVLAEETTFYNVRSGSIITAPCHTKARYGYAFLNCIVDGNQKAADGKLKLGRPWHNNPVNVWINTKMLIPVAPEGWTDMGTIPYLFAEYRSHDNQGKLINTGKRKTVYTYTDRNTGNKYSGSSQTTITASEAAKYNYQNMIMAADGWNPRSYMESLPAPEKLYYKKGVLHWKSVKGAKGYLVTNDKNEVVGIVKDNHLIITQKHSQLYTVSTINHYGHIGNKTEIHIGL